PGCAAVGIGVIAVSGDPSDPSERRIVAALQELTPEALAHRSDLVVIGDVMPGARCTVGGRTIKCGQVRVDSVVIGGLPEGALRCHPTGYSGTPGLGLGPEKMLLYLRRDGDIYEVVGF